jgi:type IV secretion system protein TrbI
VANPKDNSGTNQNAGSARTVRPMDAPDGLDIHPAPRRAVRISKRAGMAIILSVVGVMVAFAYGGYRRTQKTRFAARAAGLPKNPTPATQAAAEVTKSIPEGTAPLTGNSRTELRPPADTTSEKGTSLCASNSPTGQPFRFNPQTGQPCDGTPQERLVIRQAPPVREPNPVPIITTHEPTQEERRLATAFAREQEARIAPTSIRSSFDGAGLRPPPSNARSSTADLAQAIALSQTASPQNGTTAPIQRLVQQPETEYDEQNMQTRKESFLTSAQDHRADDYLHSTREAPLSRFEIKAGWEIPAALEQNLNSDLPGDLKALIEGNVYDTATGQYLLIPQGSRLVGKYDSRVAYGQNGVQVSWSRIIFPDASSIDLNGMVGLDSHGNAGLRDKVDRHYARIVGFSALTSLFSAAFAVSQRQNQSVLAYPTPSEAASSAVAQNLSQTGSQITRRNLNVQPTIKVPVGYKFTVRVNRDILFEAPYQPLQASPAQSGNGELHTRTSFPASDAIRRP